MTPNGIKGSCNRQEYMAFPEMTSTTLLTAVAVLMCVLESTASQSREVENSKQRTRQFSSGTRWQSYLG